MGKQGRVTGTSQSVLHLTEEPIGTIEGQMWIMHGLLMIVGFSAIRGLARVWSHRGASDYARRWIIGGRNFPFIGGSLYRGSERSLVRSVKLSEH